jgi:hypothetical protein
LVWTEQSRLRPADGNFLVSGPFGTVGVSENALALLARPRQALPVDELLALLATPLLGQQRERGAVLAELRTVIDWLLGTGGLRVATRTAEPVVA